MQIVPDMWLLPDFADSAALAPLMTQICRVAPLRHMQTARGFKMSVATTSCGAVGWISDRRGYRYSHSDPESGQAWPAMPALFARLANDAAAAAGYSNFCADSCLLNQYAPGTQMGAHQDKDEVDFNAPIVSVSLGLPARFFVLGEQRRGRSIPVELADGDVLVFGGLARMRYHGVRKIQPGSNQRFGAVRWNLTFRKAC